MITLLKDFPTNVLAVRASGHITREDYDKVLIPAAQVAFSTHEKLRVYYEIAQDFTSFEAGAMWEDFTFGIGYLLRWERVAVVTNEAWIKSAAHAFGFFMPCPVKVFMLHESTAARSWLQG